MNKLKLKILDKTRKQNMKCDDRDNTQKLRSIISIVVPSKNKNENKN